MPIACSDAPPSPASVGPPIRLTNPLNLNMVNWVLTLRSVITRPETPRCLQRCGVSSEDLLVRGCVESQGGEITKLLTGWKESKPGRDRENRSKPERSEADRNPDTALWTTVSGFESLPSSDSELATYRITFNSESVAETK